MQTTTLLKFSSSNWFLAKIVYHIISGEGNHTPQFDEQLRLIQAENELQAIQKARQTGEKEQTSFLNSKHEIVQWKFVAVAEIRLLQELVDGSELYSRVVEEDSCEEYLDMIYVRASDLLEETIKKSFLQSPVSSLAASVENCIGGIKNKK